VLVQGDAWNQFHHDRITSIPSMAAMSGLRREDLGLRSNRPSVSAPSSPVTS
jgi:hypothetical protein